MTLAFIGYLGLLVAYVAVLGSVGCLFIGLLPTRKASATAPDSSSSPLVDWTGRLIAVVAACALTFCCAILLIALLTGDTSITYVVQNRSDATGSLGLLYQISGLWAGRGGSLLFWAWLISLCGLIIVTTGRRRPHRLDSASLFVLMLVLLAFVSVIFFSPDTMPFAPMEAVYFNQEGQLIGAAALWGMNPLLEHWAMAIHPPTLFLGYAAMTVPFAYAIGALIVNDDSVHWVNRATPFLKFGWLMLSIGIGLGAVWAYVVLGWGGYWGWDPVENGSLLPWLVGVALLHSLTVYRSRGLYKRWSVMSACLAFAFVVLGTFITRSGIVTSVHAFEGDSVSTLLFIVLIVASVAAGALGLWLRRKTFGVADANDLQSVASRDGAYYLNNLVMIVFALLVTYLTLASALPGWLPLGGQSVATTTYEAVARPLGVLYGALMAVCPLLGWSKTDGAAFWKRLRAPFFIGLGIFAVFMVYFFLVLVPTYNAGLAQGGTTATDLLEGGPTWYYFGLTVAAFFVASLLITNAISMAVRGFKGRRLSMAGGALVHTAIGIMIVGLVGSSMYTSSESVYLPYDKATDTSAHSITFENYELVYSSNDVSQMPSGDIYYSVTLDVYRDGAYAGQITPSVQLVPSTQQQKLNAATLTFPLEDLFVVYRGVNDEGAFGLDIHINPLITVLWLGFALLIIGTLITFGQRLRPPATTLKREASGQAQPEIVVEQTLATNETATPDDEEADTRHQSPEYDELPSEREADGLKAVERTSQAKATGERL